MKQLIECVPNFSEGHDMDIIKQITNEIESVAGVKLLDVDPGKATNRTVVTFVGEPEPVINAAFLAIKKAAELIDMSKHSGEHPRMGATDVCPLIPIAGITMEETAKWAHKLGEMAGGELDIPFYMYESAATRSERHNLATVRSGEYEGLPEKLKKADWKPDYGPARFNPKSGAKNGNPERVPGACKSVKAIGWFIEEYGVAQISMNLTNIHDTPLHVAFEEVSKSADRRGMRVTGSELVGLVPLQVMLDAGKYFLKKQKRSTGVAESEIIKIAVKSLGLDELTPFDPQQKIIEYQLRADKPTPLLNMDLRAFANETASESPAPGGGSISAYVGALGISLATMVANLSSHRRVWDARWEEFGDWAEKGQKLKDDLLALVDEDTNSFNEIINAIRLPKGTDAEKAARTEAIQAATKYAIEVPFKVMQVSLDSFDIIKAMAEIGNPNSVTDAGVGALCARAAVHGAFMNVKINAGDLKDKKFVAQVLKDGEKMIKAADKAEKAVTKLVHEKIA